MIINGNFEPEQTKWIYCRRNDAIEYPGWFAIRWRGYDDKLYKAARKIKASRWSNSSVVVPPENFEEVIDFANMYGFTFSNAAKGLIEEAKEKKEKAMIIDININNCNKEFPDLTVPENVGIADEFKD